jgi:hypothetical protein
VAIRTRVADGFDAHLLRAVAEYVEEGRGSGSATLLGVVWAAELLA